MATVKRTHQQVRAGKGTIDRTKLTAATEADIARWKREDGIDDAALGPARFVPPLTDVRALRERLGLSQDEFAQRYMLSTRTVQEWEQQRREPSDAARVLLYAIACDPAAVARALRPGKRIVAKAR
jgi:putative transcriptional regulator